MDSIGGTAQRLLNLQLQVKVKIYLTLNGRIKWNGNGAIVQISIHLRDIPYKKELYKMYVDFNIEAYNAMFTFSIFVRYTFCIFSVYILDYEFGTPLYT